MTSGPAPGGAAKPEGGVVSGVLLALRSLLWTVLLPGVVAGWVPWRYLGLRRLRVDLARAHQAAGALCVVAGAALLGLCIWEFACSGRGTLSPVDPPRQLVVRGPYRFVRNPMYLGVTTVVLGEALAAWSRPLFLYWVAWFAAVNLMILGYEEPSLRRRFGDSYDRYAARVGRWIPGRGKA